MRKTVAVVAVLAAVSLAPGARAEEAAMAGDLIEVTTTIEAIDAEGRLVTLKDEDGELVEVYCGPEVKRFDELKVGDEVTFTYAEAVVVEIGEPGEGDVPGVSVEDAAMRGTGERPSGAFTEQVKAIVKIEAVDPDEPSVTVRGVDGVSRTFAVDDAEELKGIEVGDEVSITYTRALVVEVK